MYIAIIIALVLFLLIISLSFTSMGKKLSGFSKFFAQGKDKGFSNSDLSLLWRTAKIVGLEDKPTLFWSVPALDRCIKFIARQVENPLTEETKEKMQVILNNLYAYRTKIELEQVQKKRSLESTREIFLGQICIILVPNETTVYAKLSSNRKEALTLSLFDASFERAKSINWTNKTIRVYFWRQKDAGYIFSSKVISKQDFEDRAELTVMHSNKIVRTQKRKSVRATCKFEALMFPLKSETEFNSKYENSGGVKCTVCDISEDGAMFYVKGKAAKNVRMKLQFMIGKTHIVMCGKIVRFIYDETSRKSRVHFQCDKIGQNAKNKILSYVYNIAVEDNSEFISTIFDGDNIDNFTSESNILNSTENDNEISVEFNDMPFEEDES